MDRTQRWKVKYSTFSAPRHTAMCYPVPQTWELIYKFRVNNIQRIRNARQLETDSFERLKANLTFWHRLTITSSSTEVLSTSGRPWLCSPLGLSIARQNTSSMVDGEGRSHSPIMWACQIQAHMFWQLDLFDVMGGRRDRSPNEKLLPQCMVMIKVMYNYCIVDLFLPKLSLRYESMTTPGVC